MNLLWQQKLCNLQQLKIAVFTYCSPHFCFPREHPWGNHAKCCMDGKKFAAYKLSRSMYPSIFNSFKVIRTTSFTYRSPHFCFPWRRPCDNHAICCMDGKSIQCLPNPSQHVHLSVFNSFRVIRCLRQCVSPKIAIFTTFLFPLRTPLVQSR